MTTLVFYISGHGFGHAARAIEVINALLARRDDIRIAVRTSAPKWLFDLTVSSAIDYHRTENDTGIVQIDSLHLDVEESMQRLRDFMRTFDQRVQREVDFLRGTNAALVVSDIPPLGVAAGKRAAVPVAAMGNFTWDWIYAAYEAGSAVVSEMCEAYAMADVALRLPMHGGFTSIRNVVDLPFVARRSTRDACETRKALGLDGDDPLVLISFGGYGLAGLDLDALGRLEGYGVVVSGNVPLADLPEGLRTRRGSLHPLDEQAMYAGGFRYEDIVRAVDAVVTKPGYGIISECIANETAILYTSRGCFIEYDVLVREMPRYVRCQFIDHADLFAGRWAPALNALFSQPPPPERPAVDGADHAAERLLALVR